MKHKSPVIIGNWKMHKTIPEATSFIKDLLPSLEQSMARVGLAVPFTMISKVSEVAQDSKLSIGAQNLSDAEEGPFTGEISGRMLADAGASFVLVGHSERRHLFLETSCLVNRKLKQALHDGLQAIVCIGETLEEYEAGKTQEVLSAQIQASLKGIPAKMFYDRVILAYEPVWAIGTGKTATPEIAQAAHQFCRGMVAHLFDKDAAQALIIQYGGSVKADNAAALLRQEDIDGLLIGGASLSLDSFIRIIQYKPL